jgi:hypothetical protein
LATIAWEGQGLSRAVVAMMMICRIGARKIPNLSVIDIILPAANFELIAPFYELSSRDISKVTKKIKYSFLRKRVPICS